MFKKLLRPKLPTNFGLRKIVSIEKNMPRIKSVKELGYDFNAEGQLRKIGANGLLSNAPFQFNVSNDHIECQSHYEELGSAVTEHIYQLLENEEHLIKLPVPVEATENGTFVFASKDYEKQDVLLILIQGSGAVRAGQWARSLIINEDLVTGTQIPYIRNAVERGFGVLIMNPNDNHKNGVKISNSSTSEDHAQYVWKTYVTSSNASSIVIVAHSYGGLLTVILAEKFKKDFEKRVKAVALTDSIHSFSGSKVPNHLKKISINWISSPTSLDTPMKTPEFDITRLSAGHPKHEMTSSVCMNSVFKFIDEKLKSVS